MFIARSGAFQRISNIRNRHVGPKVFFLQIPQAPAKKSKVCRITSLLKTVRVCVGGAMASRILKLAVVAVPISTAAGSARADGNAISPDVNITDDGELVPFARCFITAGSLLNAKKQVRLDIQVLDTSTVTRVVVGLFNAEGLLLSDAEMPD